MNETTNRRMAAPVDVGRLTRSYIWPAVPKDRIAVDGPMILVSGSGARVRDVHGKSYLDLTGNISRVSSLGWGRESIAQAVYGQLQRLHYAGQGEYQADVVFELAAKLADLTPGELEVTSFTESGTTANEAAFKLARAHLQATGRKPRAYKVISRWNAYHGSAGGPLAATDWNGLRAPSEPGTPGISFVPAPTRYRSQLRPGAPADTATYLDCLERQILHEGPELVAAFIAEPVMQAGGVQIPPEDYFPQVREICSRYDVLFIADEVITGFGRTGEWFAMSHWSVEPDIVTMGKAMTAGYAPLGAVTTRREIWDALPAFFDLHTYAGHPAAAAAALAVIEEYEQHGLIERARISGEHLLKQLRALERHELVGEARGIGMWAAVDLTSDRSTRAPVAPELVRQVMLRARARGLIVGPTGSAIELAPPYDIPLEEIDEGIEILDEAIEEVERER